jgi:RNA polymerase sigma-70 factor, ECF subfamily
VLLGAFSLVETDPLEAMPPQAPAADRVPELVERALDGDRGALALLYDEFEPTVRGIALARVAPDVADDLVHDVFVAVLRKLGTLREPAAFPGWIASIARHRVAEHLRKGPPIVEPFAIGFASATEQLEAESVLRIIHRLPEAFAETLVLRFVEGMTGPEIAARTGMTPGSVRVNLCRGMKLLRQKLAERGYDVR